MSHHLTVLVAWLGLPGGFEIIIILLVTLLIFGRRLPEITRNMGRSIVEFKKGLRDNPVSDDDVRTGAREV